MDFTNKIESRITEFCHLAASNKLPIVVRTYTSSRLVAWIFFIHLPSASRWWRVANRRNSPFRALKVESPPNLSNKAAAIMVSVPDWVKEPTSIMKLSCTVSWIQYLSHSLTVHYIQRFELCGCVLTFEFSGHHPPHRDHRACGFPG